MNRLGILLTIVMLFSLLALQKAEAAEISVVTAANVNLRAGPGTSYPVVTTIPAGARLVLHSCVSSYTWCDISFGSARGWLAASYMSAIYRGGPVRVTPAWAVRLGVGIVAFDAGYRHRYYIGRPWYRRWPYYRVW